MVVANNIAKMYISRDAAQSGLYTLWAYNKPTMNNEGLFKSDPTSHPLSVLLMSIHPSRWPWDALKLDRGEIIEVDLGVVGIDTTNKVTLETA